MEKVISELNRHRSDSPSKWSDAVRFRSENKHWLKYSQAIAMMVMDSMEERKLRQKDVAEIMGCSQQYVSKILKGRENLSLDTISKLEKALGLDILSGTLSHVSGYETQTRSTQVYLSEPDSPDYGDR